jgi:phosphoglucosamine mutase
MKRLFGTDGIRAVAGEEPLDPPTVRRVGAALAEVLARSTGHPPSVVLGRDTRESGPWLRDAVAAGLRSRGARSVDAGVMTTPGVALLARDEHFDAAVMISASHNPFHDNGLKVFGHEGTKLSDELEKRVEARVLDDGIDDPGEGDAVEHDPELVRHYIEYLEGCVHGERPFEGVRLMLDCANGSAAAIAPEVFRHHGAEVETLGCDPDGRNINLDCGSLHLDRLAEKVRAGGFDLGIAFDGDADRTLAVDRQGRIVDGDYILYLIAGHLKRRGELRGDTVVATIMSNLWLEKRLAAEGIRFLRAPVGDKYVLERMVAEDAVLGGEQSGHVILRNMATTGDGVLTGLVLLETLREENRSLEEILDGIEPCPQVLINVRVTDKPDLRSHPVIGPAVEAAEREMDGAGRVVLRYSGTEPKARVMVEGEDAEQVRAHAERLVAVIEAEIGAG